MRDPDRFAPFLADRAAALRSLDAAHIRAYARRWGARLPAEDGEVFWASVHRARLSLAEFTPAEKDVSRAWLAEHGFAPKGLGEP